MNPVTKMFMNLVGVGVVSGVILAAVFYKADPMIQANKEKELKEAIFVVLPEARDYKILKKSLGQEEFTMYAGLNEAGEPIGLAFKADGGGFQGNIGVMVGLDLDYLKLKGIRILDQLETPGLGNRIANPEFEDQFKGIEIKPKVEYIKNRKPEKPNQIQSITGATISSDAVVKNINNAIEKALKSFPTKEDLLAAEKAVKPASATVKAKEATDGGK